MRHGHGHGHGQHAPHEHCGMANQDSGCCCSTGHGFRHFPSKEEQATMMEEYLENLKAEIKGVEEHLAELKKG